MRGAVVARGGGLTALLLQCLDMGGPAAAEVFAR